MQVYGGKQFVTDELWVARDKKTRRPQGSRPGLSATEAQPTENGRNCSILEACSTPSSYCRSLWWSLGVFVEFPLASFARDPLGCLKPLLTESWQGLTVRTSQLGAAHPRQVASSEVVLPEKRKSSSREMSAAMINSLMHNKNMPATQGIVVSRTKPKVGHSTNVHGSKS